MIYELQPCSLIELFVVRTLTVENVINAKTFLAIGVKIYRHKVYMKKNLRKCIYLNSKLKYQDCK